MTGDPLSLRFVLEPPEAGIDVTRHDRYDTYRGQATGSLPAVVFVPGPVPPSMPRPRDSQFFRGYGLLAANHGLLGVVAGPRYESLADVPTATTELADVVEQVRALPDVDPDRIVVWAFSGGGLLVGRWLSASPNWLRGLALTYPLPADDPVVPGRPIVVTRVGRELRERQVRVDEFLMRAKDSGAEVRVIDVPDGQHGFDLFDHTDQSRAAVTEAMTAVAAFVAE